MDHVLVGFGLLVGIGLLSSFVSFQRLRHWAQAEEMTIVKKRLAAGLGSDWRANGLFSGWCYYVTIEDKDKHVFQGWVHVGGLLAALRSSKVDVVWDNRPDYLKTE